MSRAFPYEGLCRGGPRDGIVYAAQHPWMHLPVEPPPISAEPPAEQTEAPVAEYRWAGGYWEFVE
jgi:hypothetical protein